MNKKNYFLLTNSFLILLALFFTAYFFSHDIIKSLLISFVVLGIYLLLSHSLVDELMEIEKDLEENIQKKIHEINTPVSTIQLNTSLLKSKLKDEKNLSRLSRIEKASEELLALYEEMEYFIKEKIDKTDIKTFSLKEAVLTSTQKFQDIKNKVQIKVDIDDSIMIKCDKIGFIKMIDNLVQNAIKHNPNLTKIEIFYHDNTLFVKDDGDGIDSEDICNIFNKYFKDHKAKGFGLGLSIVKEYCDKHNIKIKIDTSQKGTTFKLKIQSLL